MNALGIVLGAVLAVVSIAIIVVIILQEGNQQGKTNSISQQTFFLHRHISIECNPFIFYTYIANFECRDAL